GRLKTVKCFPEMSYAGKHDAKGKWRRAIQQSTAVGSRTAFPGRPMGVLGETTVPWLAWATGRTAWEGRLTSSNISELPHRVQPEGRLEAVRAVVVRGRTEAVDVRVRPVEAHFGPQAQVPVGAVGQAEGGFEEVAGLARDAELGSARAVVVAEDFVAQT